MSTNNSEAQTLLNRSKQRYITAYENFIIWRKRRNTDSLSEDVLIKYFEELATKYKPTSLWAMFSMLKNGLKSKHDINIKKYKRLAALLKKWSKGYVSTKVKTLSIENVQKFINEAPDEKHLVTKVALIFGVNGGFRIQDLVELRTSDIENHGEVFVIKIPHTKEKSRRSFVVQGKYYHIVKKYQRLRVTNASSNRFFQQYRNGKCCAQVIGKNRFGTMTRQIAEFLNLPDANAYTGHSFGKASTSADCTRVVNERCMDDSKNGKIFKSQCHIGVKKFGIKLRYGF